MDLGLEGKVVLATGGSDGLGRALCHELVAEGAKVAFCGRDPERLDSVAEALAAAGGDVLAVRADVTEPEDLSRFVDAAAEKWGRIDGLVNNAGTAAAMPLAETLDADWDADLQLKVYGAVRLIRFALPHLRQSGGAIVNTLAIGAKTPGGGSAPSSVSRAAGMALTKVLSKEFGSDRIRVNAVLIGLIESGQWERRASAEGLTVGEFYERLAQGSGIPMDRVGRAQEYADLVTYLLSSRSSYVTGTAINLDGGLCAVV
jgi:NAD(P)-dependent dehydrogenase (short-subunit alcohol dehydrogenase family)